MIDPIADRIDRDRVRLRKGEPAQGVARPGFRYGASDSVVRTLPATCYSRAVMNRLVLGLLGGSVALAALWYTFESRAPERIRSQARTVSPSSMSEGPAERSSSAPEGTNETAAAVSRVVRARMADAVGEAAVRVRDQQAANASAEATPIDPPNGVEVPTPEEEEKFRRIRQALGETPEKEQRK